MTPNGTDHTMIQLTINEIAPLWIKFRDAEPRQQEDLHLIYCEMIQDAMCHDETNEAFRLLAEGIHWCDSLNEA